MDGQHRFFVQATASWCNDNSAVRSMNMTASKPTKFPWFLASGEHTKSDGKYLFFVMGKSTTRISRKLYFYMDMFKFANCDSLPEVQFILYPTVCELGRLHFQFNETLQHFGNILQWWHMRTMLNIVEPCFPPEIKKTVTSCRGNGVLPKTPEDQRLRHPVPPTAPARVRHGLKTEALASAHSPDLGSETTYFLCYHTNIQVKWDHVESQNSCHVPWFLPERVWWNGETLAAGPHPCQFLLWTTDTLLVSLKKNKPWFLFDTTNIHQPENSQFLGSGSMGLWFWWREPLWSESSLFGLAWTNNTNSPGEAPGEQDITRDHLFWFSNHRKKLGLNRF